VIEVRTPATGGPTSLRYSIVALRPRDGTLLWRHQLTLVE
jgi:hypothetical protein